jgi:hypothetical protein
LEEKRIIGTRAFNEDLTLKAGLSPVVGASAFGEDLVFEHFMSCSSFTSVELELLHDVSDMVGMSGRRNDRLRSSTLPTL